MRTNLGFAGPSLALKKSPNNLDMPILGKTKTKHCNFVQIFQIFLVNCALPQHGIRRPNSIVETIDVVVEQAYLKSENSATKFLAQKNTQSHKTFRVQNPRRSRSDTSKQKYV
jgi:hypothetical protein